MAKKSGRNLDLQPAVPNTYTFSPPAESEWLPLFAVANGFDGFLRWAYHSWPDNPLSSTDFPIGPSGDAFLIYPGDRSSIRFERLRDGIESFEKIRLLREAAAANPSPEKAASLAKLDAVLADFTWQRGRKAGLHTDDVQRANAGLLEATKIPAFGRLVAKSLLQSVETGHPGGNARQNSVVTYQFVPGGSLGSLGRI